MLIATISVVLILFLTGYYINSINEENSFLLANDNLSDKNTTSTIPSSKFLEIEKQRQKFPKFDILYDDYIKKHNRTVAKLLNQTTKNSSTKLPKVIVVHVHMDAGLGNRLPGLICGFLYSMITDRLFFIDGFYNFLEIFEKDFEHDWESVANLYNNSSFKYLHNDGDNEFQLITRGNLNNEEINSYDILYVQSYDYVCAPIISNPNYKEWISSIIPDNKIYGSISQKLLRLKRNIIKKVADFVDNNFGEYNIGIHLRVHKNGYTHDFETPTEHYCYTAKMLITGMEKKNVTIFIAADDNANRDILINCLYSSLGSKNDSVKIVHAGNDMDIYEDSVNPGTEIGALADLKILSLCDDLVVTFGSSFSFIASGWSYKSSHLWGPYVVMPVKNNDDDFGNDKIWVWKAMFNEPCMYTSKSLLKNSDPETVKVFKTNPFWMYYSEVCF
ncbi:16283_t:CDS:1 [Dentiscutata heterogama]|uniref:16283_t:CDS:1 n=1 Tax=Dentiscutata heterogama TaxID=1316150 RepID=A0ACA9L822_9GLOM|nr:16283_t:CDS:1 [Dentiscutata heterogama]